MLYKLSIANIKKSFKDYAIYFTTLLLGVCIFYIFNSMDSQTAMLAVSSRQSEVIDLLIQLLSAVSVFVSLILGFLIIYASRFLIKKRNKEFGIYMTLGMSKRKISVILLIETFIIGLISLGVGLLLGIVISQITSIFIANMFEANMTDFTFNISKSAIIKTIIYFGIIYFIVMIFNTIIVSKNKLINLLQSTKKGENIKVKNSLICIILFIISVILLASAYYMVTGGVNTLMQHDMSILLVPIGMGVVGTVLFFYSLSGMILKIITKFPKLYYSKLNTFVFKQINSKINTMIVSISVICLMLFITLCLLSSALTVKNYFNDSINKLAPVDLCLVGYYNEDNREINLIDFINSDNIIKDNTKDITTVSIYEDQDFTYGKSLGNYYEDVKRKYPYVRYDETISIMGLSDYNKLAKMYHMDSLELNRGEYAIVSNYESQLYEEVMNRNSIITIFGTDYQPSKKLIDGFLVISGNPSNIGFFVVEDETLENNKKDAELLIANYSTDDEALIGKIETLTRDYSPSFEIMKNTKIDIKEASVGLSAIVTFIGLYLGIIFLISSSAILALKSLSDCIDDKNKYKVLRQIGADEKEVNKVLFKQTLIFFMMPLFLAIVHTLVGLEFCKFILSSIGVNNILNGSIMTFIFLLIIYGIYFMVTYFCSKNIIKERY
ncbi:MAG: ABC transporter permease [Firmicutes bacterium]|nr:ABC transporter permease [Bacillota bacterium]